MKTEVGKWKLRKSERNEVQTTIDTRLEAGGTIVAEPPIDSRKAR
ncbi:hypothetical protein [Cupriavidus sp. D384]|nr:hypothetical protein [Cupriavidus sp. D384]